MDEGIYIIDALHRQYAGVIYDLCLRILRDRFLAEDAVQETFVNAFKSLSSFRYGESHLPWLYRIGTNVCFKMIRANRNKDTELMEHPERISAQGPNLHDRIYVQKIMEHLLSEADERGRDILIAHYIWGMNQSQIATSLGISRRAVVKRLSALRKRAEHLFGEDKDNA